MPKPLTPSRYMSGLTSAQRKVIKDLYKNPSDIAYALTTAQQAYKKQSVHLIANAHISTGSIFSESMSHSFKKMANTHKLITIFKQLQQKFQP